MKQTEAVRIIRVFISSASDVAEERRVLDEVIARINRTDGQARRVRLEVWKWEAHVVPQIGPNPQGVVDTQTPAHYDIYLGIMKHRFGTPTEKYGSGTEKEFNDAVERWGNVGSPWILFYFGKAEVDPYELDNDLFEQLAKVRQFRKKLEKKGLSAIYEGVRGSSEGFFERVEEHLRNILQLLMPLGPGGRETPVADATAYLRDLLSRTAYIDIRNLQVGETRAHRFPIEDLFISLTATQAAGSVEEQPPKRRRKGADKEAGKEPLIHEGRALPLRDALRHERLVVVGDPGAGKTTFVRRIAHALCQTELGFIHAAKGHLGISTRTFPILVRLNELHEHISRHRTDPAAPAAEASPTWLPHFLAAASRDDGWGLDHTFFTRQLEGGFCTILLDGLDEAPDRIARQRLSQLIENIARSYRGCRLVVTSRPAGYSGQTLLPDGGSAADDQSLVFAHARIAPLSDNAVEAFLSRWCQALYGGSSKAANFHCSEMLSELLSELKARPDIHRMARNPVMLTALAVVHWNERRLPEQRSDLYESIIRWLSRSREQRPGREKADRTLVLLQELALAMQNHPDGMLTSVPIRWAAERLATEYAKGREVERSDIEGAVRFIESERLDSGIIYTRGGNVSFWQHSLQEYLAARALAARRKKELYRLISRFSPPVYDPSWKEVILLLASLLHMRARSETDGLVRAILTQVGGVPTVDEQLNCIDLLSSIETLLSPLGYRVHDARYHRLKQDVEQVEFVRQIAQSAGRTKHLGKIGEIVCKLPEGESGFLRETSRIREMVREIVDIQNRLDSISQPVLREPYARLLVKEIENFQHRVRGLSDPLAAEFTKASEAWLQLARSELTLMDRIVLKEAVPQVFRAGDPVDADHEAFVIRFSVMGEIERQVMLSSGCPGIVLYARRRMGKSTVLRNLPLSLPSNVHLAALSMQHPQAFHSLPSFLREITKRVGDGLNVRTAIDSEPGDLSSFFDVLQGWDQFLRDNDKRLIIALDEYENIDQKIGAGVFPLDLLAALRESIQWHRHIVWLFSGSHEIAELDHAEWTSYLVSARTIEIPPFSEAETRLLLTEPLRYSRLWPNASKRPRFPEDFWGQNGIERIHAEAGGWPHLVQLIAETAIDLLNTEGQQRMDDQLFELVLSKAIVSGHNVLHQLMKRESRLQGEWEYLRNFKASEMQPPPSDYTVARSLQRRLLVQQAADQWQLRVPLLKRWLRQRA